MRHFSIQFENPWFLLLLIPAIAFTLIPYFRSAKKYRKTRNRITSMVLHALIMVLTISVLSGISFRYDVPNKEAELILLVDKSDSGTKSDELKDSFVYDVLNSAGSKYKVGIVTFGYDQVYAAPLSTDSASLYNQYLSSQSPDVTATDIASALTYASTLFSKPEAGRIVLISDGIETDGAANSVIKNIAAQGIKVDTVHFPNEQGNDVQIISSKLPNHTIKHGEKFVVQVDIQSSYEGDATITVFDDATQIGESKNVRLEKGITTHEIEVILPIPGLHKLSFEITSPEDVTNKKNNEYNSFVYIEIFDKILIVESIAGESESLKSIMPDKKVTVVNVGDAEKMPKTVDDLRKYDEVILVNIANSDMPKGFDEALYSYVKDIGGGLFTVCGNKDDGNPNDDKWEANAFTEKDMYGTLYQQLLPVEIIEYTPPAAIAIVIDCSGSMYDPKGSIPYEKSKLYAAKQGAESCFGILSERDWVGIVSFSDTAEETLEMTRVSEGRDKFLAALETMPQGGGETKFKDALAAARSSLLSLSQVEKKHIIIVTDGAPTDGEEKYGPEMQKNAAAGITMSIVGIDCEGNDAAKMRSDLVTYAGLPEERFREVEKIGDVAKEMRNDLELSDIQTVNHKTFTPGAEDGSSIFNGIDLSKMPTLDGFYGSKVKEDENSPVEVILSAPYVPIYAQWKVGKGTVGSFMCDLNGTWSSQMLTSDTGKQIINNIVAALFPTENIRKTTVQMALKEQNYNTQMNIFANIAEGDTVEVNIIPEYSSASPQNLKPSATDGFSRVSFETVLPGIYGVEVVQKNADGTVKESAKTYKAFSYSQEYNTFHTAKEGKDFLAKLSADGDGVVIDEAADVFENIVKYLEKLIDPRLAFVIISLIAFLLDVAVRKFKFLWPHEIVRLHKEKKALK